MALVQRFSRNLKILNRTAVDLAFRTMGKLVRKNETTDTTTLTTLSQIQGVS